MVNQLKNQGAIRYKRLYNPHVIPIKMSETIIIAHKNTIEPTLNYDKPILHHRLPPQGGPAPYAFPSGSSMHGSTIGGGPTDVSGIQADAVQRVPSTPSCAKWLRIWLMILYGWSTGVNDG